MSADTCFDPPACRYQQAGSIITSALQHTTLECYIAHYCTPIPRSVLNTVAVADECCSFVCGKCVVRNKRRTPGAHTIVVSPKAQPVCQNAHLASSSYKHACNDPVCCSATARYTDESCRSRCRVPPLPLQCTMCTASGSVCP